MYTRLHRTDEARIASLYALHKAHPSFSTYALPSQNTEESTP